MPATPSALGGMTPGVIIQHTTGDFGSVLATNAGQSLLSTGANAYSFNNFAGTSSNSSSVQLLSVPPPVTDITPFQSGSILYNPAAQFLVMTVTPTSVSSTFIAYFSATCNLVVGVGTGLIMGVLAYLNAASVDLFHNQVNNGSGVAQFTAECGAASPIFSTGSLAPFTMNYCSNANFNPTTGTMLSGDDYFNVIEFNSTSVVPTIPAFVSTSAAPVLVALIPSTTINTSTQVTGYVVCNDTVNQQSNLIQYLFVMQQGASLGVAPTIAQGLVLVSSITATSSLTFTPVIGGVSISFVGIAATTFVCQQTYVVET